MTSRLGAAHSHAHAVSDAPFWLRRTTLVAAAVVVLLLYATGTIMNIGGVDTALVVALLGAYPLLRRAAAAIMARQVTFDATVAVAAVVAIAARQYLAAAEVVVIIGVGDAVEHWVMHRADRGIAALLSIQPQTACVVREGVEQAVPASDVRPTDLVVVRSGERIPVDGLVMTGEALVDQSSVTGESIPALKAPGAAVVSGTIVQQGALELRAERVGADTAAARIGELVREAKRRRAPIVRLADRLARWFLPAIVISGLAVYVLTGDALRTVSVLLVGCSCALVYAAPAAFAAALARLARAGVFVKGGDILEQLSSVTIAAFDKTGTLTLGQPTVANVVVADGFEEDAVLRLAAAAESRSEHCLGRAIVAEVSRRGLRPWPVDEFVQSPGLGVAARVAGRHVRVGSAAYIRTLATGAAAGIDALSARAGQSAASLVAIA
ncbi:MAG: heavy metal translocating P-type ATPase, partial [Vicinamibacterales bacterium]